MSGEMCVCGHGKEEHEKQRDGSLVCFHDDAPDVDNPATVCPCMELKAAETKAAGKE